GNTFPRRARGASRVGSADNSSTLAAAMGTHTAGNTAAAFFSACNLSVDDTRRARTQRAGCRKAY
ncbi:MAG TPA: hypothetical protein VN939_21475, partial [Chthoniobacterales bacterium]|nr:hypothetical protein [Chthoniobacterales bacterium]